MSAPGIAARESAAPAAPVVVQARHPLDRVVAGPVLGTELVDPCERRLRRHEPRPQLLALFGVVALDVQRADELRQGQPLEHQGREHHSEGGEDDEATFWEGRT